MENNDARQQLFRAKLILKAEVLLNEQQGARGKTKNTSNLEIFRVFFLPRVRSLLPLSAIFRCVCV